MEVVVIATWIGMLVASFMNTPATTTVVLIDNEKHQNAIVVETKAGSTVIDKAGQYVSLSSKDKSPSEIKTMSKSQIESKFGSAITAAPLKPVNVLLYFKNNSNELTDESKDKLPLILKQIQERMPCDVNVIGHTDTKGSNEYNVKLSLERAQSVKEWIVSHNVDLNNLKVESYGENDLLIKTKDNVSEDKNRRVEILIR